MSDQIEQRFIAAISCCKVEGLFQFECQESNPTQKKMRVVALCWLKNVIVMNREVAKSANCSACCAKSKSEEANKEQQPTGAQMGKIRASKKGVSVYPVGGRHFYCQITHNARSDLYQPARITQSAVLLAKRI